MKIKAYRTVATRVRDSLKEYVVHPGITDTLMVKGICGEYMVRTDLPSAVKLTGDNAIDGREFYLHTHNGCACVVRLRTEYANHPDKSSGFTFKVFAHFHNMATSESKEVELGDWAKINPAYKCMEAAIKLWP